MRVFPSVAVLASSLAILSPNDARACRCAVTGPFASDAEKLEIVVRVAVIESSFPPTLAAGVLHIEIKEVLKGFARQGRAKIVAGTDCPPHPDPAVFTTGTEWIFAARRARDPDEYHIPMCGTYWLRVSNSGVSGEITQRGRRQDMSLHALRRLLGRRD